MRTALYIVGGLIVAVIALNLIGRSVDQQVAEKRHYDMVRKVDLAEGLRKFGERQEFLDGITKK